MAQPKRILLVDDEESVILMVGKRLQMEGFEVIVAADGQEALEKVQSERPDLIVLDLMLPKLNGYSVCSVLKRDPELKKIPVIIFTAKTQETDDEVQMLSGAEAYVRKPFRAPELLGHIRRLLHLESPTGGPAAGFSLIEVLVAIVILGIGGTAILQALGTVSRALMVAEERAAAYGVACSTMAERSLARFGTPVEKRSEDAGTVRVADQVVQWQTVREPMAVIAAAPRAPLVLESLALRVAWSRGPRTTQEQIHTLLAVPRVRE